MNWLQKLSQSTKAKPMALPFDLPEESYTGTSNIDNQMTDSTAREEQLRHNPEYLGSGSMGVVGLTDKGIAVKYTDVGGEAALAEQFMNDYVPCIPKIFEVRQIQTNPSLWSIAMEQVKLLPDNRETNIIVFLLEELLGPRSVVSREDKNKYKKEIKRLIKRYPYLKKLAADYRNMMDCLKSSEIDPWDINHTNIGYDQNGNLVLFDLGLSSLI